MALLAGPTLAMEAPSYAALRAMSPEKAACAVHGLVLRRDVFTFRFEGTFAFLSPVQGRRVGAVFVGAGSLDLEPAAERERRHLALLTGSATGSVHETFGALSMLFTDGTAEEIDRACVPGTAVPGRAEAALADFRNATHKTFRTNLDLRILEDLLDQRAPSGVFISYLKGASLPPLLAAVDPRGVETLGAGDRLGGAEVVLWAAGEKDPGFWYLSHLVTEPPARRGHRALHLVDARSYAIESQVLRGRDLQAVATIRFRALEGGTRVLPVHLLPHLRIQKVEVAAAEGTNPSWAAADFVQEKAEEDADAAVLLPSALIPGREVQARISYQGSGVLVDAGDGNFVVGARESWYPNFGLSDPATFDLTFRVPKAYDVVSAGAKGEERIEAEQRVTRWSTPQPVRMAGFNYGRFQERGKRDETSGIDVRVFTNPGTPDVIREINRVLRAATGAGGSDPMVAEALADGSPIVAPPRYAGPSSIEVSAGSLADGALADGLNAARLFTTFFGPLETRRIAISQQSQWMFGQSWPSLIFLPYVAFLDATQRRALGLQGLASFVDAVGFHEFAHQWWGHEVGSLSYEDDWLTEGFAEFSSALALQYIRGPRAYDRFWEGRRQAILATPRGASLSNDKAGPITMGLRLFTSRTPEAHGALVYGKGAYVLHMLRMTMREAGAADPDAAFRLLLQDYLKSFRGLDATTRDFQAVAERHLVPALNATHDGRLDWFFDQWVRGTEIPRYVPHLEIRSDGGDAYRIVGSLQQEGVSPEFRVLLPLYLESDKGAFVRVGVIPLKGSVTAPIDVPFRSAHKPRRAVFNALHDVLARD
jgi:hypothetical protein